MANHIGNTGQVLVGANVVAEVVDFSVSSAANIADDTVLNDVWSTHAIGTKNWSGSLSCYWDETNTLGQEALTVGAGVTLTLIPEGAATGSILFSGAVIITGIERAVSNDAIVTASFTFQGNGELSITAQPAP